MSTHFVTIEKNVSPNAHWQVVARDIGKARAQAIAYALCQYVPDALVRVHAGTPDDQCIMSMWHNGEFVSYDAWLAMLATPATPATYSVIPDVNDDAKCQYISNDMIGTFKSGLSERDALRMAEIVSRCVASHVFVILEDASGEYVPEIHEHAIYRRGVLVTPDAYATYRDTVLFAHEHTLALQDRILGMLANREERSDIEICETLHASSERVCDAIDALYESDRISLDARDDATYVRLIA